MSEVPTNQEGGSGPRTILLQYSDLFVSTKDAATPLNIAVLPFSQIGQQTTTTMATFTNNTKKRKRNNNKGGDSHSHVRQQKAAAQDQSSGSDGSDDDEEEADDAVVAEETAAKQTIPDLEAYASMDKKARASVQPQLTAYPFRPSTYTPLTVEAVVTIITDLQTAARQHKAESSEQVRALQNELDKCKRQLALATKELQQKRSHVDELSFKREAERIVQGETMMKLFRSYIFLSKKQLGTKQLLSQAGLTSGHPFVDIVFKAIFDELEKPLKTSKQMSTAQKAGKNIYSNGEKHIFNNDAAKKQLWSDFDFASKFIHKFNHKRNQQASMYRRLFGE